MNGFDKNADALKNVMGNIDDTLIKEMERNKKIADELSTNPVFTKIKLPECPKLMVSLVHLLYSMYLYLSRTSPSGVDANIMSDYIMETIKYMRAGIYYDYHIVNATTLFFNTGYEKSMQFSIYANSPRHSNSYEDKDGFAVRMIVGLNKVAAHKEIINELFKEWSRF